MASIASLGARQILDSRGNPTIEVECVLSDKSVGRAAVPSGASTGTYEALELRDGDKRMYGGKSVQKAVANVQKVISKELVGNDVDKHRPLDTLLISLDGTPTKSVLGANAMLGVSMAICQARAQSEGQMLFRSLADQYGGETPMMLPVPLMNVLNGGKHADSGLSIQEFMIVPTQFTTFSDALRAGVEIFHALKSCLTKEGHSTAVGDEGGFAPRLSSNREALDLLMHAIEQVGYSGNVQLAMDAAASEFYSSGVYHVDGESLSSQELVEYYADLISDFPIVSIEDSHSEDDWEGFAAMYEVMGERIQLVGDDLFVTNSARIQEGIEKKAANAVLIKLNQIGTVSETVDAISTTQHAGWHPVISHRSGETEDTFIAHLAVGLNAGQIKTGSLCRTDRTCKYNELLRIEEAIAGIARYESPFLA